MKPMRFLSDPKKRIEWEKKIIKNKDIFENRFPTYEEYLDVVLGIKTNLKMKKMILIINFRIF